MAGSGSRTGNVGLVVNETGIERGSTSRNSKIVPEQGRTGSGSSGIFPLFLSRSVRESVQNRTGFQDWPGNKLIF